MNELITPFGQLRPLQGGNLARVANLKEVDHKLSSRQECTAQALPLLFPCACDLGLQPQRLQSLKGILHVAYMGCNKHACLTLCPRHGSLGMHVAFGVKADRSGNQVLGN